LEFYEIKHQKNEKFDAEALYFLFLAHVLPRSMRGRTWIVVKWDSKTRKLRRDLPSPPPPCLAPARQGGLLRKYFHKKYDFKKTLQNLTTLFRRILTLDLTFVCI